MRWVYRTNKCSQLVPKTVQSHKNIEQVYPLQAFYVIGMTFLNKVHLSLCSPIKNASYSGCSSGLGDQKILQLLPVHRSLWLKFACFLRELCPSTPVILLLCDILLFLFLFSKNQGELINSFACHVSCRVCVAISPPPPFVPSGEGYGYT